MIIASSPVLEINRTDLDIPVRTNLLASELEETPGADLVEDTEAAETVADEEDAASIFIIEAKDGFSGGLSHFAKMAANPDIRSESKYLSKSKIVDQLII